MDESGANIICLQETKAAESTFPALEITTFGYPHQAVAGFGEYNGVAILSKQPLSQIKRHIHCERDDARHISAVVQISGSEALTVNSLYVPAGGGVSDAESNPKFAHKLRFVGALADYFAGHFGFRDNLIVAGDLNIAPLPSDV